MMGENKEINHTRTRQDEKRRGEKRQVGYFTKNTLNDEGFKYSNTKLK